MSSHPTPGGQVCVCVCVYLSGGWLIPLRLVLCPSQVRRSFCVGSELEGRVLSGGGRGHRQSIHLRVGVLGPGRRTRGVLGEGEVILGCQILVTPLLIRRYLSRQLQRRRFSSSFDSRGRRAGARLQGFRRGGGSFGEGVRHQGAPRLLY